VEHFCKPRPLTVFHARQKLFDKIDTVILTSATLAVAGGFDFTKQRLGLRNAGRSSYESFRLREAGLLTCRKRC